MKNKYIIFILLITFILPIKVFALSSNLELSCDTTTISVDGKAKCTLYGSSDEYVSAVELDIVTDDNLTITDITIPSVWQGDFENNRLLVYTDTNKINKFELLNFNVSSDKVGDYNISFKDVEFTSASFTSNSISNKTYGITVTEKSSSTNETIVIDEEGNIISGEGSSSNVTTSDGEENPKTGGFIPVMLISTILIIGGFTFVKVRKKKIYKL